MARGLGINVDRAFAVTFALGCGLAGLGGALAIEIVGLDPSFAFTYLVYVLIVVSVGGLGSIGGSFAAAAVLGISDIAGKYYVPAARRLPDLSGDGRPADVAARRPVREALMPWRSTDRRTPQAYLQRAGRWRRSRSRSGSRRCCRSVLTPDYLVAGEPDRDHRAVRALARSDPRLCRHRLARPRGVLRHRRLHRRACLAKLRLGRADDRAAGRRRSWPAWSAMRRASSSRASATSR